MELGGQWGICIPPHILTDLKAKLFPSEGLVVLEQLPHTSLKSHEIIKNEKIFNLTPKMIRPYCDKVWVVINGREQKK